MKMMGKRLVAAACSAAMTVSLVPVFAGTAYAGTLTPGTYFEVNGLKYEALAIDPDTMTQVVYVVSMSDESRAVQDGILRVPNTVSYEGSTFNVRGISQAAFRGCTSVEDIRIDDLTSGGVVNVSAFDDCTSLKVIHFMGGGRLTYSATSGEHYFNNVPAGLKVVGHKDTSIAEITEQDYSSANLPVGSEVYCEIDFNDGSKVTPVYVKTGSSVTDPDAYREGTTAIKRTLTASGLSALSANDVYTDTSSADPICPNGVQNLPSGKDAWAFSADSGKTYSAASDYVASCGSAYSASDTELNYSTVSLKKATLRYCKKAVAPTYTVVTASGKKLDNALVSASYATSEGKVVTASELVDPGTYTITCSAADNTLAGKCSTTFSIVESSIAWTRQTGADRHAEARAVSSDATSFAAAVGADAPSNEFIVLVNPDNYAACVLADSLAGLLNCSILTTGTKSMPASTKVALATSSKATVLVLGSKKSISADVQEQVGDYVRTYARVTNSDDAATMASDVATFVSDCKAGKYEIEIENDYGKCAMVLPADASSSAFGALTWAYSNKAPVFFMGKDGKLSDAATTAVKNFESVKCVGASTAQSSALSSQLTGMQVEQWNASTDEYATAAAYAELAVSNGSDYAATAIASIGDYGVLSSAAAVCGNAGGVLLLGDDAKGNVISTVESLRYQITAGRIYAGRSAICEETYENLLRMWLTSSDDNLMFGNISVTNKMTASGEAQTPKVVVKNAAGKVLTEGTDYELSFIANATNSNIAKSELKDAGAYTVTARGTYRSTTDYGGNVYEHGYYKSYVSATFSIAKNALSQVKNLKLKAGKKSFTASWTKLSGAKKYQLAYKLSSASSWKTVTNKKNKLTLKKLKKGKNYVVRVRAVKGSVKGIWSASKSVKAK